MQSGIDGDDFAEELQGLVFVSLEGIAADDGTETAALTDGGDFLEDSVVGNGGAAGENGDAAAVEGALDNMLDAFGEGGEGDFFLFVNFARGLLLELVGRQLDFDDVRAQFGGNVGGVAANVEGGFAGFAQGGAPGVGPDDDGQAVLFGLGDGFAQLLVHGDGFGGAGINGKPNGGATEAQGVLNSAGQGGQRVFFVMQRVMVVNLEDEGNFAGKIARGGFEEAGGGGIGVAAARDGQLEMVARIVGWGIGGETAGRAVLEALVRREDDEVARASEFAVVQEPG